MKGILLVLGILVVAWGYTNPVQGERDSPDPGVLYYGGAYYAVTTEGWDSHYFPIWKSTTGTNFTQVGWVFPTPPKWTVCCDYWAPELHIINGNFLVYFTARSNNHMLAIGSATSSNILGPYVDRGSPLVTNASEGVIDATVLKDGASNYIVYKVDGNAHGHQTELWAALLDPTGMKVVGQPIYLMRNDQSWEHGIIEGQWFVNQNGKYYLFYSGCGYSNDCYAVGVAMADHPLGPYTKNSNNPILKTRNPKTSKSWEGPGHCSVVQSPEGRWLMFYHAWPPGAIGTKRLMLLDEVIFEGVWPRVNDGSPSESAKPDPR